MNEETHNITTIDELQNYIGKPIVCYYYKDYVTEYCDHQIQRKLPEEEIKYMWMFKLTEIEIQEPRKDNTVRGKTLYGQNTVVLLDYNDTALRGHKTIPHSLTFRNREKEPSSAQSYVRTPTKKELITYMNIFRRKRIFGI